jgi:Flp pilus assembly protein TadD
LLVGALAKNPNEEDLLYSLGAAYQRNGEFDKSIAQMRALLKIKPDHAAAMNFIGYSLVDKGKDLDEAERLVMRALELDPDSGAFLDSLGWLYFHRGDYQRAVDTLERAASLEPDEPLIIEHLGDAYRRTSKNAQAGEAYRRALKALTAAPELQEHKGQKQALERKLKMLSTQTLGR